MARAGNRIDHYQDHWKKLFPQHPEIVRKVSQGILIAFDDVPPSLLRYLLHLPSNDKTADLLHAVQKPQVSQAIEEVMDIMSPGYYSRLFLVMKPDGSFRPIIDLKKLNQFLIVPSFKMETLFSIVAALQPQEWITKIDLKDAYHHILVHVNILKYFRFVVAGVVYQFHVRTLDSSTGFHQDISSCGPTATHSRHPCPRLLGRLEYTCAFSRTESRTYTVYSSTSSITGLDDQLGQINVTTLSNPGLSGFTFQPGTSPYFPSGLILTNSHQGPISSVSYTSSQSQERYGGCSVPNQSTQPDRMAHPNRNHGQSVLCLRNSPDRHVCHRGEQGHAPLCFSLPGQQRVGGRRRNQVHMTVIDYYKGLCP